MSCPFWIGLRGNCWETIDGFLSKWRGPTVLRRARRRKSKIHSLRSCRRDFKSNLVVLETGAVIYRTKQEMDQEPIVNALIASFLALGGAVDEATLQRTGNNLRALIYDPDSALHPRTIRILEDILIGVDHAAMIEPRL